MGDISKSLIRVNRIFTGVGYDEDEIPRFNSVTFSVEGIDEWIGRSGINVDYQFEESAATISYQLPENIPLNLGDGMHVVNCILSGMDTSRILDYQKNKDKPQRFIFKLVLEQEEEQRELE